MATKADIEARINTIDTAGNNTAAEVRNVYGFAGNSILENIYGNPITENTTQMPEVQIITTKSGTSVLYRAVFQKSGRTVNVNGVLNNSTAGYLSLPEVFDITLSEYQQDFNSYRISSTSDNGDSVEITLNNNKLQVNANLAPFEYLVFNFSYNTLN